MSAYEPSDSLRELVRQGLRETTVDATSRAMSARPEAASEQAGRPEVGPVRRAAAVLASFEPLALREAGPSDGGELYEVLAESALLEGPGRAGRWALDEDARRRALRAMAAEGGADALRRALDAVPAGARPDDPAQTAFERYVAGRPPDLDALSLAALDGAFQAARWLDGALDGVPAPAEVRERIAYRDLLAPFERLVGDHFRGRERELARLGDYVGVQEASSTFQSLRRFAREVFDLEKEPPLLIHGPGGSGKSTLVAKFVLDHARLARGDRFPFVYLDFDRPGLSAAQPATLLVEALRQLAVQYPEHADGLRETRRAWHRELRRQTQQKSRGGSDWGIIPNFEAVLSDLGMGDRPLLFVLDTFEEVQHRGGPLVENLGYFLIELQRAWPRLRTVLAGRAPIGRFPFRVDELPLPELDAGAAQGYLEARGIPSDDAAALARRLGGDPLTLALAAKTWALAGREGLAGIDRTRIFRARLRADQVQGQLYERILAHAAPEVRKLAHPGLVLRRLTPELILDVLDGPCALGLGSLDEARALFDRLRADATLVTEEPDGALRHRPDVRRVMVRNLTVDRPALVEAVHRGAVAYYERTGTTVVERAEELYHRLALGQSAPEVDARWMEGAGAYFTADTVEELGAAARLYLASRVSTIAVDEALRVQADLETWERLVAADVAELVAAERLRAAYDRLRDREARSPASPLLRHDVEVALRLGFLDEANRASLRGLDLVGDDVRLSADLLLLQARIARLMDDDRRAARVLDEAGAVAETLRDPVRTFAVDLDRLALGGPPGPDALDALAARYLELPAERLVRRRALAYRAATALADDDEPPTTEASEGERAGTPPPSRVGRVLSWTVDAVGFEMATEGERVALAKAVTAWDLRVSEGERPGALARSLDIGAHSEQEAAKRWRGVMLSPSGDRLNWTLKRLLSRDDLPHDVAEAVRRVYAQALADLTDPEGGAPDGLALV